MQFYLAKKNNFFPLSAFSLVVVLLASAFYQPIYLDKVEKNWEQLLSKQLEKDSLLIQNSFDRKSERLVSVYNSIYRALKRSTEKEKDKLILTTITNLDTNVKTQVYKNKNLIAWNSDPVVDSLDMLLSKIRRGEIVLLNRKQSVYLTYYNSILLGKDEYTITISSPIHQFYSLQNSSLTESDFVDSLSTEIHSDILLDVSESANHSKDGRRFSFTLFSPIKNKIAVVSFTRPSLDARLNHARVSFRLVQSFIIILLFIIVTTWFYNNRIIGMRKGYKYLLVIIFSVLLRVLLFILEIPASIIQNELTSASNFSSQFAFGMVRSPLEFLLTALLFLSITFTGYLWIRSYLLEIKEGNRKIRISEWGMIILCCFLILLLWRGFGASVKSIIMDSTIRYFKEFTLSPPPVVLLMCFNLLVLGAIIFFASISLLMLIERKLSHAINIKQKYLLVIIFFCLQVLGWLYDLLQSSPQGTDLIRIIFVSVLTFVLYYVLSNKFSLIKISILILISASIISVSLLTNYNTRLEKESLRNTAYDLVRINQSQVQFIVYQTLTQIKTSFALNDINDYYTKAFELWTKSLLYREGINSSLEFYNKDKKYLGGFTSIIGEELGVSASHLNPSKDITIIPQRNVYDNKSAIYGYVEITSENSPSLFIVIKTSFTEDHFNYSTLPKIISVDKAGISSALDLDAVKIFDFHNNSLNGSYGEVNISETEQNKILDAPFENSGEAWTEIELNGEKNLVFVLKQNNGVDEKVIALARPEKRFSWNLSDFFKIFFIHIIFIASLLLLIAVINIGQMKKIAISFQTKLSLGFLVVSIIPLLIVAFYIRGLTDEKNEEVLSRALEDKATQVSNYLVSLTSSSNVDLSLLSGKVSKELSTNFSIYHDNILVYSSYQSFYSAGILGNQLNPFAYKELSLQKRNNFSIKEKIEGEVYYSSFKTIRLNGNDYVIQVGNLFNQVLLPISSNELDVFMFGIFSFVVVLIIIFSAILSGQISSPIRKLTQATRAVAGGDYNLEITDNSKGEIKELVTGFNQMVRRVNQSQIDIAKYEREEAWREMAKQVAHEIKNPLTPMKLSVQQLIIAYKDKSPKFDSIFEKVTATIIMQIETLRNIASEFSNFARMPRVSIEKINLVSCISEAIGLYNDPSMKIKFSPEKELININADNDHLKRTIVNIIRNAHQANATEISIFLTISSEMVLMRLTDNGAGIPEDIKPRIFEENYTTKSKGMGIGLSMAKKFIESISGSIEVETTSSSGTTFLVTIPVIK